jgi:hypothetical protein
MTSIHIAVPGSQVNGVTIEHTAGGRRRTRVPEPHCTTWPHGPPCSRLGGAHAREAVWLPGYSHLAPHSTRTVGHGVAVTSKAADKAKRWLEKRGCGEDEGLRILKTCRSDWPSLRVLGGAP